MLDHRWRRWADVVQMLYTCYTNIDGQYWWSIVYSNSLWKKIYRTTQQWNDTVVVGIISITFVFYPLLSVVRHIIILYALILITILILSKMEWIHVVKDLAGINPANTRRWANVVLMLSQTVGHLGNTMYNFHSWWFCVHFLYHSVADVIFSIALYDRVAHIYNNIMSRWIGAWLHPHSTLYGDMGWTVYNSTSVQCTDFFVVSLPCRPIIVFWTG